MNDLATDPGIFIRSMASRGSLGGLATTTKEVIDLMDAFGFERVLVETVGVGQTELEITAAADTVVVILVPESGDAIQAMKAGLMEIADIFVINKADRPGAGRLAKEIRQALHLRTGRGVQDLSGHHGVDLRRVAREARPTAVPAVDGEGWEIPVMETNALDGSGVPALVDAIEGHRAWLERSGELAVRRRDRIRGRVRDVIERDMRRVAWSSEPVQRGLDRGVERISAGEGTPYSVARELLELLLR
jgi:LAO/AO transport system kinase